jgi:hypothetical protein
MGTSFPQCGRTSVSAISTVDRAALAQLVSLDLLVGVDDRQPGAGGEMGIEAASPPAGTRIDAVKKQLGGGGVTSLWSIFGGAGLLYDFAR